MHQREHQRTETTSETRTLEDDLAPGRVARSQLMDGPSARLISGLISRKASDDGAPIDDGADHAVAAVASSSGTPLPDALARRFESSLDTDLSSVRIHTGSSSAAAAGAVRAKAFAVGTDIHFGNGFYDPTSSDGQLLLAHEVAHTVQQRGGAATRQNKLEVSHAGDAAEVEADRAAEAMVAGRSFAVTGAPVAIARKEKDGDAEDTDDTTKDLHALATKCGAERIALGKAASKAGAISAAITKADSIAMEKAATEVASALRSAEKVVDDVRGQLAPYDESVRTTPPFRKAKWEYDQLDKAINTQSVAALNALRLPGASTDTTGAAGGGESIGDDVEARAGALRKSLVDANNLRAEAKDASNKKGKARLDAAQIARSQALAMSPAVRRYAMKVVKDASVAADVVAFLEGNGAALRKAAAAPETGAGGSSSSGDAEKPGSHSGPPGVEVGKVKITDPASGEGGVGDETKVGPGTASGTGTVDVRSEEGKFRFEGAKLEAGYTVPGAVKVKVSGGYTQSISPPTFDGTKWIVNYTSTWSGGGGGGPAPEGGKWGAGGSASGARTRAGARVFETEASATAFYEAGDLGPQDLPDAAGATQMREGESRMIGDSYNVGANGSVTVIPGVSVGASGSYGGGTDVKLTKGAGEKVVVTIRKVNQYGGKGEMAGPGVSAGAGGGKSKPESVTVEFDLATEAGKAAYGAWLQDPKVEPSGAGVRVVSRGKGDFGSTNVGVGVLWGSGSTTETTGEFTETTADGKHSQTTIVGSKTDATTGLDLDKQSRSDSLEITTTDNGEPTYTIKTSISSRNEGADAHRELAKVTGEATQVGQGLDDEKATGSGKWSVEGTYTKAQIDEFQKKVVEGKVNLTQHGTEAGNPAADLKQVLSDPKATPEDKKRAMAEWFSKRGSEAADDLRSAVGEPEMSISLEGDKHLSGAAGQAVLDGKLQALEDRLLDPKLEGDAVKTLLRDTQSLYADQLERKDHIANPTNYAELPNGLRHKLVQQAAGNLKRIAGLRNRVAAQARDAGLGDPDANPEVNKRRAEVNKLRGIAVESRSAALDRRRKHDGAGSAGIDSARREIHRTVTTNKAIDLMRGLYSTADQAWKTGIEKMEAAEASERTMMRQDGLSDDSREKVIAAGDDAIEAYRAASKSFILCRMTLDEIYKRTHTQLKEYGTNYETGSYGTID